MNRINELTDLQIKYMNQTMFEGDKALVHDTWFSDETTDFWRHKRMYETISLLAKRYRKDQWLTVGDGRYGLDAIRLKKLFQLESIFPTDIGENMLQISKDRGLLENYGVENAECLSFPDNSYDVVFCKESFHHFPRPYLALYEMIRVSKKAVIMIEPSERSVVDGVKSRSYLLSALRLFFSKIFRQTFLPYLPAIKKLDHSYEEAGNYLYAVSVRELEKLAYGLGMPLVAYRGFNDVYEKGCEFESAKKGNPLFDKINSDIERGDLLCSKYPQYHQPNMISVILFKETPEHTYIDELSESGFQLLAISKNPYV